MLGHSRLPFASLQTLKTPKTLRGSFHQGLWPSAFAAPGLQPALCLHIPPRPLAVSLCCSRVAACPLPAHSPLLLGHSSLPFASLQTLKTPIKPSAAASTKASGRQPLLPPSSWPSALQHCSLPFIPAHSPLLLRHSSLPFASLQTLKTPKTLRGSFHQALWPSAFAAPGLQPALCLRIPRGSFHQAL